MVLSIINYLGANTLNLATQRIETSWQWYVIRAAGFVAAGLLILLMISGIGQVTGITYRLIEPIKAWIIHKALAIALCVSIAIHGGLILFDHFVPFTLAQLLIPFDSHYNNGTKLLGLPLESLGVTFGILAMYGVAIIVASSLGWINSSSRKRTWRLLHYLGYLVFFFVFLHALYVGSDLRYGLFRSIWILFGVMILIAVIMRLWRSGTMKNKTE